jgi:endonuclease YncB( thermonuclease family)
MMIMRQKSLASVHLIAALLLQCAAAADTISGRVVKVSDGDTLTVLDAKFQQHKVRLNGIDAPETGQPFGSVSGDNLSKMVFGKQVTVAYDKRDRYGRILGKVLISGQDASLVQIEAGLAWHYKAYQADQSPADRTQYATVEIEARKAGLGLWADSGKRSKKGCKNIRTACRR